ncbi:hypothetical protein [Salirhabdus sp. Marseille-P4669]|uniref:hypothetical protein n=1 Tax=Salirhabdus sp. Marseille-P4669 TaxID=2042310 RepID=UPI000C7B44A6|nr:hypothetical protein [Salirhabdus sp. Marseille-P4669]
MIFILNIGMLFLYLLIPILLIKLIHAIIKQKPRKILIQIATTIIIGILIFVLYYLPKEYDFRSNYEYHIDYGESFYNLTKEQKEIFTDLLNEQLFQRNIEKTVLNPGPYPAGQAITIFIPEMGHTTIHVRLDKVHYSYLQDGAQLYTILDAEPFKDQLVDFVKKLELKN